MFIGAGPPPKFVLLRTSVVGVLRTLFWFFSAPWLLPSLLHKLVWCLRWGVDVFEVVLLSGSWGLLSSPGLVVVHCGHAHSGQAQIPMLRRTLQSCCCRILVWEVLWGIQCFLFQQVLQTCCKVACRLPGPNRCAAAPEVMLMSMYLRLLHSCVHFSPSSSVVAATSSSASVSTLLLLFLFLLAIVEKCCPVGPCMLKTCASTPQMLHNFHHMLAALVSACVLMLGRSTYDAPPVGILCHVPKPSLLLRAPHTL